MAEPLTPFAGLVIVDGVLILPASLAPTIHRACGAQITEMHRRGIPPPLELIAVHEATGSASSASGTDPVPERDTMPFDVAKSLCIGDGARLAGITERGMRKAISAGRVQAVKVGREWRVDPESLAKEYGCPVPQ